MMLANRSGTRPKEETALNRFPITWYRLMNRSCKHDTNLPRLGFNSLRDTSAQWVRARQPFTKKSKRRKIQVEIPSSTGKSDQQTE
jgi:hypothetical protein